MTEKNNKIIVKPGSLIKIDYYTPEKLDRTRFAVVTNGSLELGPEIAIAYLDGSAKYTRRDLSRDGDILRVTNEVEDAAPIANGELVDGRFYHLNTLVTIEDIPEDFRSRIIELQSTVVA